MQFRIIVSYYAVHVLNHTVFAECSISYANGSDADVWLADLILKGKTTMTAV